MVGRGPARITCSATRATAPGPTASCCVAAALRTPSPSPVTSRPTDPPPAPPPRPPRPVGFDKQRYKRRNVVERGFNQLKEWRGLASRTDKHAINYRGAITLRATLAWIS